MFRFSCKMGWQDWTLESALYGYIYKTGLEAGKYKTHLLAGSHRCPLLNYVTCFQDYSSVNNLKEDLNFLTGQCWFYTWMEVFY